MRTAFDFPASDRGLSGLGSTVHKAVQRPPDAMPKNTLQAYHDALQAAETCRGLLRSLILDEDRHGSLQAALSQCRNLAGDLQALIDEEERTQ